MMAAMRLSTNESNSTFRRHTLFQCVCLGKVMFTTWKWSIKALTFQKCSCKVVKYILFFSFSWICYSMYHMTQVLNGHVYYNCHLVLLFQPCVSSPFFLFFLGFFTFYFLEISFLFSQFPIFKLISELFSPSVLSGESTKIEKHLLIWKEIDNLKSY